MEATKTLKLNEEFILSDMETDMLLLDELKKGTTK